MKQIWKDQRTYWVISISKCISSRAWGLPQSRSVSVSNMEQRTVFPISAESRDSPHTTHENSSERILGPYLENQLSFSASSSLSTISQGSWARHRVDWSGRVRQGQCQRDLLSSRHFQRAPRRCDWRHLAENQLWPRSLLQFLVKNYFISPRFQDDWRESKRWVRRKRS